MRASRPIATRSINRGSTLLLSLLVLDLVSVAARATDPDSFTHSLTSDRVDGVHENLDIEISPIELGPVVIQLSTPTHRLEVLEHELQLGPAGDGAEIGRVRARFSGQAHLVAELGVGEVTSEIDDNIELPLQEIDLRGRVELVREGDGYRVKTLETPSHVEVQVESDLAGRLELLCRGFAVMAMGNVDCEALDRALTRIQLPLPEPGREFFVSREDLTPHERQQIEEYFRDGGD